MKTSTQMGKGRMSWQRVFGGAAAAGAVAMVAAGTVSAAPASAASQPVRVITAPAAHDHTHTTGTVGAHEHTQTTGTVSAHEHTHTTRKYYFAAGLLGRNEVREPGKKVDDPNGVALAKFRISGNRFYYVVQWKNTGRPTAFHIHRGKAGVNGPVVIDLLSNGTIRGNTSFGSVRVKSSLLAGIKKNPKNWYANLHTAQFPDGAVRGQLHKGGRW
ncbi:CHRD domain-containing protein [Sphaerisporangium dianthi]|uniref:CHRD domain-containing protein n=1 Tax=Sphaerisporangium dianthi TaxID=1436120 RepID=A0ABV9CNU4_9ACTN